MLSAPVCLCGVSVCSCVRFLFFCFRVFIQKQRINHNATPPYLPSRWAWDAAGDSTPYRRTTLEDEDSVREYCVTTSNAKFQAFLSESRNESMDQHMLCVVDVPLYAMVPDTQRKRRLHQYSRGNTHVVQVDLRAGPSI